MNLGDPELELIDPTPNVHAMFLQFDRTFFWAKLASRAVVRWSKKMYSCAGVCSYEGRGGLCDIALSEPLLKLRPRKDLVETLLHEMIHAFLFITLKVQDRDGHGPNFKEHMYRINKAAGINISIYHSFHEEVELYQTHWWRCNGPCQFSKPHYGIVRRAANSAPGPRDYWWTSHQRKCGGTFIKINEPEKKTKPTPKAKKTVVAQPKGDITKYITSSKKTTALPTGEPKIVQINDISSSTVGVSQKGISNPVNKPAVKPPSFLTGKGYTIAGTRVRSNSADVTEVVRNIWAKKQLTPSMVSTIASVRGKNNNNVLKPIIANVSSKTPATNANKDFTLKAIKHKTHSEHVDSPPVKVKKIDDYFKKNATSLLKDIYGSNIEVVESGDSKKLIAVDNANTSSLQVVRVDCPICGLKIEESKINCHLDECLNKDLISKICNGNETAAPTSQVKIEAVPLVNDRNQVSSVVVNKVSKQVSREILATLPSIPPYKPKLQPKQIDPNGSIDYKIMKKELDKPLTTIKGPFRDESNHWVEVISGPTKLDEHLYPPSLYWSNHIKANIPKPKLDLVNVNKAAPVVQIGECDKHLRKSDSFVIPKNEKDLESASSSIVGNDANVIKPPVKIEPGPSRSPTWREMKCPCCGNMVTKPMKEHLDECLAFLDTDPPPEEAPANIASQTIVIDDEDDEFDESQVFNATGTKLPCPCCLQMVENDDMNAHLDTCLS